MSAAPAQATAAAAQHVAYVTVLLGANDLCTSSPSTMTSTGAFAAQFREAMAILKQQLPQARIFVSSLPDLYQLWKVLHTNRVARTVWAAARHLPLHARRHQDRGRAPAGRRPRDRLQCRSSQRHLPPVRRPVPLGRGRRLRLQFHASQVSILDFFHPDLDGQAALARVTWAASWWPTT